MKFLITVPIWQSGIHIQRATRNVHHRFRAFVSYGRHERTTDVVIRGKGTLEMAIDVAQSRYLFIPSDYPLEGNRAKSMQRHQRSAKLYSVCRLPHLHRAHLSGHFPQHYLTHRFLTFFKHWVLVISNNGTLMAFDCFSSDSWKAGPAWLLADQRRLAQLIPSYDSPFLIAVYRFIRHNSQELAFAKWDVVA